MNILTFDVEEWFHILDHDSTKTEKEWNSFHARIHSNTHRILDLLDKHDLKATFFCLGWIAKKYPEVIKDINKQGHEIGCHSHMHQLIYQQTRSSFINDLDRSVKTLEDLISNPVLSYRAPGFSITENSLWALEELMRYGIKYDSSIFPAKRAHGGIQHFALTEPHIIQCNGMEIKEFPMSTKNIFGHRIIFSGGGYFRLLPYPLINSLTNSSNYVMTYFHPRDFDPEQPIINDLSRLRKFKSYYGLSNSFSKLERLIQNTEFIDLREAISLTDWTKVPKAIISTNTSFDSKSESKYERRASDI